MATAPYGGFIPFDAGEMDQEEPIGIDIARVLFNNAMWACEGAGQVRVCKVANVAAAELTFDVDANSDVDDVWYRIWGTEFDTHLHPDGGSFRYRVRLGGRTSNVSATGKLRMYVGPRGYVRGDIEATTAPDSVLEVTGMTSTTSAWLTATGSKTLITVPRERVADAYRLRNGLDAISGREVGIPVATMVCEIYGQSDDVDTGTPFLSGAVVQEYIGT